MQIANTLPELIGNTPLLRLERFAPGAGVLASWRALTPCPPPRTGQAFT